MAEAIGMLLKAYKLEDGCNRVRIMKRWEELLGPELMKYTRDIQFRHGELTVKLDSAPLRNELSMSVTKLMESLNEGFPVPLIKSIRFA